MTEATHFHTWLQMNGPDELLHKHHLTTVYLFTCNSKYCNFSIFLDSLEICCNFKLRVIPTKDVNLIASTADPDLGLQCLTCLSSSKI